jgi:Zn finger protein HypA/HybF involved in hydrogenase expression
MKETILVQKTRVLAKKEDLEIPQIDISLQLEQKERVVDCPDCFDTMIKIYDADKIRYQCENCDLIIGEGWL